MSVNFRKPVFTRSGLPVTILTTQRNHDKFPVVGMVRGHDGEERVKTWTIDGNSFYSGQENHWDLVNNAKRSEAYVSVEVGADRVIILGTASPSIPLAQKSGGYLTHVIRLEFDDATPISAELVHIPKEPI